MISDGNLWCLYVSAFFMERIVAEYRLTCQYPTVSLVCGLSIFMHGLWKSGGLTLSAADLVKVK